MEGQSRSMTTTPRPDDSTRPLSLPLPLPTFTPVLLTHDPLFPPPPRVFTGQTAYGSSLSPNYTSPTSIYNSSLSPKRKRSKVGTKTRTNENKTGIGPLRPATRHNLPPVPNNSTAAPPSTLTAKGRKRKNEDASAGPLSKKPKPPTVNERLHLFFGFLLDTLGWSYGELLYYSSLTPEKLDELSSGSCPEPSGSPNADPPSKEEQERRLQESRGKSRRAAALSHFFHGRGGKWPTQIIENWLTHPYGREERNSPDMYSLATPYTDVRHVRPGLTSFAAQVTSRKLTAEAEAAVDSKSGLHMALTKKTLEVHTVEWADIGSQTPERVQQILKTNQPLTWSLLMRLAARPPRTRNGVKVERIKRDPEIVVTGVLSTLNFSRTSRANLLPLAIGLLFMGSGVSWDIFRHSSRFGITPGYDSVLRALRALSDNQAELTQSHGRDVNTVGRLGTDNIQNYLLQRDPGIGRENKLNIGLAATYYEFEGVDASVFDLDSKREYLRQGKRQNLTVDDLFNLIDAHHLETVGSLQWLSALVSHIPELEPMKTLIAARYKSDAAKHRLPAVPTKVHPLATSSHSESTLPELKAALADFLEQTGQTKDSSKPRLFTIGGDGLTFEKLVGLKEMLQFHDTPFESFEFIEPLLEWWHTMWTDLSRIFETYWGNIVPSSNPASLGHSAKKIGRKQPANLKKVDFYPNSQLAYLILDARLLDCWRLHFKQDDLEGLRAHFRLIAREGRIPTFDELESIARGLFRTYTSIRARHRVMKGTLSNNGILPIGQPYPQQSPTGATQVEVQPFKGDQVLAQSMAAMSDLIWSREVALATADGDPGRLWEVMKMRVFTFAGSAHSNYTNYLLEMITRLEFESSPDLRNALLHLSLVNLTGKPGHFAAGDFIQEYFNRLLEAVVQHKGVEYGDKFIRDTWSRNLHHIAQLKSHWLDGIGLASRSSHHTGSKTEAEMRILIQLYADEKLHTFRPGRKLEQEPFIDDFEKGIQKLQDGKLKKWTHQSMYYRDLQMKARHTKTVIQEDSESQHILEQDGEKEEDQEGAEEERRRDLGEVEDVEDANDPITQSFGLMQSVNGELVFCDLDLEGDANEIMNEEWECEDDDPSGDDLGDEVE